MKTIAMLADKMLARVAPKTTAAACGGCYSTGPYAGPCPGGYGHYVCCQYWGPGNQCFTYCNFVC